MTSVTRYRRRWLLIGAAALIPIALGALSTLVIYATRSQPAAVSQLALASEDNQVHDGSVLIIQPRTAREIMVPLGQVFEIVLATGQGQNVSADNPAILASVSPNPPCHVFVPCRTPGAQEWTFRALSRGVAYLHISFGVVVCPPGDHCPSITQSPTSLLKPIAVYLRPSP